LEDATPIGTGPGFLASHNLVRGFKVHVSVVDPLATPLVAQSVDIETAAVCRQNLRRKQHGIYLHTEVQPASDDYYSDPRLHLEHDGERQGLERQRLMGFKWWDFAYPTLVTSVPSACGIP